ncbi:MAG: hypothetical protein MJ113_06050 [Lachnospiraceae bacterium]|nr:hypothetical protein [Lachnospiraceae bacterium]
MQKIKNLYKKINESYFKYFKTSAARISLVISVAALVSALFIGFVIHALYVHDEVINRQIESEQQKQCNLICDSIQNMVNNGASSESIIRFLKNLDGFGSNKFVFFTWNDRVLFARDDKLTQNYSERTAGDFNATLSDSNYMISRSAFTFDSSRFVVGIVANRYQVTSDWETTTLTLNIIILCVAYVIISLILFIISFISAEHKLEKNNKDSKQINSQNLLITQLNEKNSGLQFELEKAQNEIRKNANRFLDINNFNRLLKKSDETGIRPMGLIVMKMELDNRYLTKGEIVQFTDVCNSIMGDNRVIFEVRKGVFTIVSYGETKEEFEEFLQLLKAELQVPGKKTGIYVILKPAYSDNPEESMQETYNKLMGR